MKNRIVHVRCVFRCGDRDEERAFDIAGRRGVAPARYCSDRDLRPLPQPEQGENVRGHLVGVHVDGTRDGRLRVYLPDGAVYAVERDWVLETPTPAEAAARKLRAIADLYQMPDGQPGNRGIGRWGWRTIAEELRRVADEVERER